MQRLVAAFRALCAALVLASLSTATALAVPVLANGQGVSCESCHTMFPAMTRYGMSVMMSNFQILNWHLQHHAFPIAVRAQIDSYIATKSHPGQTYLSDLSYLSGGFIGKNITYYVEQHTIDSGAIGDTEQAWLSWNGLLKGTNSLQVGKFHTPFPFMPAHAWTISSYLLATQTTGQNDWNPNEARWGVAFNGMSNEFMYNFSYLTGSDPVQGALNYNATDNPRALDFNISYGGMEVPWSVGIVGVRGDAPLHDASTNAYLGGDAFTREGVYYGYQTNAWHLQTMYFHGYDAHADVGEYGTPLNGFMFELGRDIGWRNHVAVRYDVASSDSLQRQYLIDIGHNILPNLGLIGEYVAGPGQRPQVGFRLQFAGPYVTGKRYLWKSPVGASLVSANAAYQTQATTASSSDAPASAASSDAPTTAASPAAASGAPVSGDANAGAKLVGTSGCTGCHGANFQGGIGPKLFGIEHRLSTAQIADYIKHPRAPMPDFGFSDAQISDIVAYLSALDGGSAGAGPTISLDPAVPADHATVYVTFPGTPPEGATVTAIMQMGTMNHHVTVPLQKTDKPNVLSGVVHFSMGGPWTLDVQYDGKHVEMPINVNGG